MALEAAVRAGEGVVVIELHGDLSKDADAEMTAAYQQAEASGAPKVLLNFTDVGYISSTGIALVVTILAQARKNGLEVLACGLTDHYREIFEITRLADFVKIYPDEAAALTPAS